MILSTRFAAPVVALVSLGAARAIGDDSAALLARFRAEGPTGWARLEQYDDELTYTAKVTSTDTFFKDNKKVEHKTVLTWVRRPGCLRVEKRELDGDNEGRTTVSVHTESHMFQVSRAKDGGPSWRLMHSGAIKKGSDTQFLLANAEYIVRPTTSFIAGTFYRCLDLDGASTITLEKARTEDDGIRIDFHSAGKNLLNIPFDTRGSIVFDPANNWAVRSYQHTKSSGSRVAVVNTFAEPDRDGVRRIASKRYNSYAPHGTVVREIVYESTKTGPAPPERFRLADFGLPDPLGPLPNRFATAYALAGAAAACGLFALWFRRRARKARAVVTPGSAP
jgi:hypothetical protein